jgi:formylglycine-generating enzyme required for sulfatase activity
VTVAQFRAFVGQNSYRPQSAKCLEGIENHPVVNVTWYDASAYCKWLEGWLRKKGPKRLREQLAEGWRVGLPSEAEWEKAARGRSCRKFTWGNKFDPEQANIGDAEIGETSPVGSFPGDTSPYGVVDMCGNVVEWCADWYDEQIYTTRAGKLVCDPRGSTHGIYRVCRGGSWNDNEYNARCAYRGRATPTDFYAYFGFRLALSLTFSEF